MLFVETDVDRAQRTRVPDGRVGFWAAAAVNAIVAVVFWVAVSREHGDDWVGYHYEHWVWPIAGFLGITGVAGVVAVAVSGWRRFGVGILTGVVTVALCDVAWTFLYLVSQDS